MFTGQVIIPAGGKVQLTTNNARYASIDIQDRTGNAFTVGDSQISATWGIQIPATGTYSRQPSMPQKTQMSEWYVYGTVGDVIDFLFEQ